MIVKTLDNVETLFKGKARAAELAQGKNAFIGLIELDEMAEVPIHRDSSEEYLYVLSGNGVITIDEKSYEINKGTIIYMPTGAEVSYKNGNMVSRFLQVFAGPDPATKYDTWSKNGQESFSW